MNMKRILSLFILVLFSTVLQSGFIADSLAADKEIAIFNLNDVSTDPDSMQAFIDSLVLGSLYKDRITQYFISNDEVKADKRAADAATVLFPLAEKLGVDITVLSGFRGTDSPNKYHYRKKRKKDDNDLNHIGKIIKDNSHEKVIQMMKNEIDSGKEVYILNGGSLRLLSTITEYAPEIMPAIHVHAMVFKIALDYDLATYRPSWNECFDWEARDELINFLSKKNVQFKSFNIIDSSTVHFAPILGEGMDLPAYEDFMEPLKNVLSSSAYTRLLDIEKSFHVWVTNQRDLKFMDSLVVFEAFGKISIPRETSLIYFESEEYVYYRSATTQGFSVSLPSVNGEHPFAYPENFDDEETYTIPQTESFLVRKKRVTELRERLILLHQEIMTIIKNLN